LFAGIVPEFFGTLPNTMFTMWIYLTQDGWASVLEVFLGLGDQWVPAIYSILFIMIGPFILSNAFIGVIVNKLQLLFIRMNESRKARHRKLQADKLTQHIETQKVKPVVRTDEVQVQTYQKQTPLAFTDLSRLSLPALENYSLILAAVEDNLAEFKQLKETLEQILLEVKKLNQQQNEDEEEDFNMGPETEPPGDVISQMIRHS